MNLPVNLPGMALEPNLAATGRKPAARAIAGGTRDSCRARSLRRGSGPARLPRAAFTLLELILVMTLLSVVMALAAPSLARFFRGRGLDLESRRFLALTRYAQSRAVSEGTPMVLWIDPDQRLYGLQAEFTYTADDELAAEYALEDGVDLTVGPTLEDGGFTSLASAVADLAARPSTSDRPLTRQTVMLRFTPDGFIAPASPEWVQLQERRTDQDGARLWVALSPTRLHYELRTNEPALPVR